MSSLQNLQQIDITNWENIPILQQFYEDLPARPYCADGKGYSLVRGKRRAREFKFIQTNHLVVNWLIIDIDSPKKNQPDSTLYYDENLLFLFHDRNLPTPQIIIRNPTNGHVQYLYRLKSPVYLFGGAKRKPINYLELIKDALNGELGGDPHFSHTLSKNPLATDCDVFITGAEPMDLNNFAEYLDLDKYAKSNTPRLASNDSVFGRNCSTFDYLRQIAYKITANMCRQSLESELLRLGQVYNSRFEYPMRNSELRCIVRSIVNYCNSSKFLAVAENIEKRRERAILCVQKANASGACSKGGQARANSYSEQRERARALFEAGMKKSQIAKKLGVSRPSVYAWLIQKV